MFGKRLVIMAASMTNLSIGSQKPLPAIRNPSARLKPIKRRFDRIETERVYRVIEDGMMKHEEQKSLLSIISDDKKLFSLRDAELRDLVLKHQHLVHQFNLDESRAVDVKNSLKNILR